MHLWYRNMQSLTQPTFEKVGRRGLPEPTPDGNLVSADSDLEIRSLSNTTSCLTMVHSISYHLSHWPGEKKENALSATLYTLCFLQKSVMTFKPLLLDVSVTKGGGDIYQHYKQFQHLKNIALNILLFNIIARQKISAHKGVARGDPPIECCLALLRTNKFQVLWLNFS